MVTPPPSPASSLCRLPVIHTDGNNFFPAPSQKRERATTNPAMGEPLPLALALLYFGYRDLFILSTSPAAFLIPHLPLWTGVWPSKSPCFGVFSPLPTPIICFGLAV